jgi:6-phosphogluconolactonase
MSIELYTNHEKASRAAAQLFTEIAVDAIANKQRFTVALSGGNAPQELYKILATQPFKSQIPWKNTFIFWGDERFVPRDDPENNARMAREMLLNHVPIPSEQIFPIPTAGKPEEAAENYASTLASVFGDEDFPQFDLILLGLGENGHTASLFPHTGVLDEKNRWTGTIYLIYAKEKNQFRITLTAPVINHAKNIIFLAFGKKKADILANVLEGPQQPQKWPAQLIEPSSGSLYWFIDEAAGKKLQKR